jgi:hypothetical protein
MGRIADPEAIKAARKRDGCCLYGLISQDGCVEGFDVHHIETRGSGGSDLPNNLICLCRKHHQETHAGQITKEQLRGVLKRFYGI